MPDVTLKITTNQLAAALSELGYRVPETAAVAMRVSIEALTRDVVRNRMHNRKRYIGVVTGAGVRSVQGSGSVQVTPERVIGSFGSSLIYIRAHELGFHGRVQVRGHVRRNPKRSGRVARTAREQRAGSSTTSYVRAHSRLMNIRAKHFFSDTMREGSKGVERRIMKALFVLAKTGKVPTASQVGA